jgi:soluble lytic murein transglycosylase-like protein
MPLLFAVLMAMAVNPSLLLIPPAEAATFSVDDLKTIAVADAEYYHLNTEKFLKVVGCESNWDTKAVGSLGELGLVQILPSAHKDISKEDMLNPYFSLHWMAKQWSLGRQRMWSCFSLSS